MCPEEKTVFALDLSTVDTGYAIFSDGLYQTSGHWRNRCKEKEKTLKKIAYGKEIARNFKFLLRKYLARNNSLKTEKKNNKVYLVIEHNWFGHPWALIANSVLLGVFLSSLFSCRSLFELKIIGTSTWVGKVPNWSTINRSTGNTKKTSLLIAQKIKKEVTNHNESDAILIAKYCKLSV